MKKLFGTFRTHSYHVTFWIIILLLIVQTFVTSITYKEQLDKNSHDFLVSLFEEVIRSDEEIISSLKKSASLLASDPDIINYFSLSEINSDTKKLTSDILRNYVRIMGNNIKNIYLYRNNDNTILDMYGYVSSIGNLHASPLEANLTAASSEKEAFIIFMDMQTNTIGQTKSMYCSWPEFNSNNACIIELSASFAMHYTRLRTALTSFSVTTSKGNLIFSSGHGYTQGSNISSEQIFEPMSKFRSNVYFEPFKVNNTYYFTSKTTSFRYIATIDKSMASHMASKPSNYIYLYISLFLSIMLIFRIYSFIPKILVKIKKLSDNSKKNEEIKNDLYLINNYLNISSDKNYDSFTKILQKHLTQSKFSCIQLNIEGFYNNDDDEPSETECDPLYLYGIDNIINEVFHDYGMELFQFHSSPNILKYICSFDEDDSNYYDTFTVAAFSCIKSIESYIKVTASFFTTAPCSTNSLPDAYHTLPNIVSYRYLFRDNVVLTPDVAANRNIEEITLTLQRLTADFSALLNIPQSNLLTILQEYEDTLALSDPQLAKSTLWDIVYMLRNCNSASSASRINTTALLYTIESSRSIYEVFSQLRTNIAVQSLKNGEQLTDGEVYPSAITGALQLIEELYSDQLLCPKYIADKLGLTSTYLNRLFKSTLGISIVNSIKEKRLRESLTLLLDCKVPIKSIAERVGFSSSNYFIVSFRQYYGVTPSQYRKDNLSVNSDMLL